VSFDTSDVLFTASLVELILHKKNPAKLNLILCGTCGADITAKIGDCFEIQEATKIDRGDMYPQGKEGVHVDLRPTMRIAQKPNHKSFHKSAIAICSNYLMHVSPSSLYQTVTKLPLPTTSDDEDVVVVADMETFEFFMICEKTQVRQYRALRVVSDTIYVNPDVPEEESKKQKKKIRKAIPMKSLVIMVNKLVSEALSTGMSPSYQEHTKQRILSSAQVRFAGLKRPDYKQARAYYGPTRVVDLDTQWKDFETGLAESRKVFRALPVHLKFESEEEGKTASESFTKSKPSASGFVESRHSAANGLVESRHSAANGLVEYSAPTVHLFEPEEKS
jgi:hypothetical protein